jgi:hypothetical protein
MQSDACGLWLGGALLRCGRLLWPYERESRACERVLKRKVGMFFSSYVFQIDRVAGKPIRLTKRLSLVSGQKKGGLFYVNAQPNSMKSATILLA